MWPLVDQESSSGWPHTPMCIWRAEIGFGGLYINHGGHEIGRGWNVEVNIEDLVKVR